MEKVFLDAYQTIKKSPDKNLQLPIRRSILFALGEIEPKTNQANFTKGKKLRSILALYCVEKIMPLWYLAFPNDHRFDDFIYQIRKYINTKCNDKHEDEANELRKSLDTLYCKIDLVAEEPQFYMLALVGFALTSVAGIALVDEEILRPAFEGANDEDLDSFTWDTAYMTCMLYEHAFGDNEETVKFFRYSFWKWYIDEVVKLYNEFCV